MSQTITTTNNQLIYDSVKIFLDKIYEESYQIGYGRYNIQKCVEDIRQYELNIVNNTPFGKWNDMGFLVKRLYAMVTGKRFVRKILMAENNRELLINLSNSAAILLLIFSPNIRSIDVLSKYLAWAIPYNPNATRGVDEVLKVWKDFDFSQYLFKRFNSSRNFHNKAFYSTTIVMNVLINKNYGILKALLAAQFNETCWDDAKKIEAVKNIFNIITLPDGTINAIMLTKILQFFTRHNNIIAQNIDDENIVEQQRTIIRSFNNIKILGLIKTMPESMWDSVIAANIK